jgi:hypothetical protein
VASWYFPVAPGTGGGGAPTTSIDGGGGRSGRSGTVAGKDLLAVVVENEEEEYSSGERGRAGNGEWEFCSLMMVNGGLLADDPVSR